MDFYEIVVKTFKTKGDQFEIYPRFKNIVSKDLMVRGKDFYAFWDEQNNSWCTDEYRLFEIIDGELNEKAQPYMAAETAINVKYMWNDDSGSVRKWRKYLDVSRDNFKPLDSKIIFSNTPVKRTDYSSKKLPYPLEEGEYSAWDELVGKLYSPEERQKIEWAIGAIVSGDSRKLQKFLVFYGKPGSGKSTILNIVQQLFEGYTMTFDAKTLTSGGSSFATEAFRHNSLVGIQYDANLSRVSDNTLLNAIVSHDPLMINQKYVSSYTMKLQTFLLLGTNYRVEITDTGSGLIRRLIDVVPTGEKFPEDYFDILVERIDFELGAIAYHCLEVYKKLGRGYYQHYRPTRMMRSTNPVFNFVELYFDELSAPDGITRKRAWVLFKEFCEESNNRLPKMQEFADELSTFYDEFIPREGTQTGIFRGFRRDRLLVPVLDVEKEDLLLKLEHTSSLLDDILANQPAQIANSEGNPKKKWVNVDTTLADINTNKLHFVKLPTQHIVIDFDIQDEKGEKSLKLNLKAASSWAPTYAELSKSGKGVHLHYIYNGDVTQLSNSFGPGIEVKTLLGDASLRRKLTKCNDTPIATLTSGLPTKEKAVHDVKSVQSERSLRELIRRNLRKEIHPGTKPSIDFIKKILDDAYASDLKYDVSDLKPAIITFAANSTHKSLECLRIVKEMKFVSEQPMPVAEERADDPIAFFDVEVYPNLFVVCWKYRGDPQVVRLINPSPNVIEELFQLKLVGFNNRRYDNHILWARFMGYNNKQLYELSKKIIESQNRKNAGLFGEAYGVSYADIYEFASKKQSLKKWQIELGLKHEELDIPWDEDVPEDKILEVVEYCVNDVNTTEQTFEARLQDFVARQILASISELSVNDTTPKHTAKIIFGNDKNPQTKFIYTDLSELFPGYEFDPMKRSGKSSYKGEDPGEGGLVRAKPGVYENVALLDIASMHPTSIIQLNMFGPYTKNFEDIVKARLAIKHREFAQAREMLGGKLAPYLDENDEAKADALAYALKIIINIVYGLTSASFDNPFRDPRNKDNIVAKRGALFMMDLREAIEAQGFTVAHIKTDSVKIPNATPEIIEFVSKFGEKYGYTFEHEATYRKFALVNDAVYIAHANATSKRPSHWEAVGAQFQHPYIFKTLFSREELIPEDFSETKSVVQGAMYLEVNGEMRFVGRAGRFTPVKERCNGGTLYRVKDDKKYAVTGTKGYLWKESDMVEALSDPMSVIDQTYFDALAFDAIKAIDKYVPFPEFVN